MKIPADAIIPREKLTQYLLVLKPRNDKSQFLAQAGFTPANPDALLAALRALAASADAAEDSTNEYGTFYRVIGQIIGVNGVNLAVATIWLKRQADGKFQFITLKPHRDARDDA